MIAIAGPDIPRELLLATARYAGPLRFDPERPTPQADLYLESKFAPWTRPLLQSWIAGDYDALEKVLFSRADDSSQRLYYYICELQRRGLTGGPEPLILDISRIMRPSSLERNIAKLREMAARLEVGPDAIEAAIVIANARRAEKARTATGGNVLITGSPAPDHRLEDAVKRAGFKPLGTMLNDVWTDLGDMVDHGSGDPCAALGRWIYNRKSGPRSFADPAALLAQQLAGNKLEAVILWRIEEDEAQCWHLPKEREVIEKSGIPSLIMTRRDGLARDGATEEIEAFLKGIRP